MCNFAEWHAGLSHSIRTWIHAQKNRLFLAGTKSPDELIVRSTGILQRIIDRLYWIIERELSQLMIQVIDDCVPRYRQGFRPKLRMTDVAVFAVPESSVD